MLVDLTYLNDITCTLPKLPLPRTWRNVKSEIPSRGASLNSPLSAGILIRTELLLYWSNINMHTFSNIALWKNYGLNHGNQCTIELRFEIPSACRPISASLLASSRLLTPQLGATLVLQRMCTFILHTDEWDKRRGESLFRHRRAWCWPPILRRVLLLQCSPCLTIPHSSDPQWSQKVGDL